MQRILIIALVAMLASAMGHAQETTMILSSGPPDTSYMILPAPSSSDTAARSLRGRRGDPRPRVWIVTNPVALVAGLPGYEIPPYAGVIVYFRRAKEDAYGIGGDISLQGGHPGVVVAAQYSLFYTLGLDRYFWGASFAVRRVNEEDLMINMRLLMGWQWFFWDHLAINAGAGLDIYTVTRGAPHYKYPGETLFALQFEAGYAF